jgi:hypothetical protein
MLSRMRNLTLGVATALVGATLLIAPLIARFSTTEYVSGNTTLDENDPGGWMFARDAANAVPYTFGFGAASIGGGSLYVPPIAGLAARKFIGELFLVTPMADIDTISFDFKIGAGGDASDTYQYYGNVYANFGVSSSTKFYDCRYDVVPTSGSTGAFTTVTFDPLLNYPVTTRGGASASPFVCPASPAAMGPGATLRAFSLNLGDTGDSDIGLDGYFDNVVVTTTAGETVYDFEPVPQSKNDCMGGGWQDYGTQFKNQGQCVKFIAAGKR